VVLDLQPARSYPYGTTAGNLLGYVLRDDSSKEARILTSITICPIIAARLVSKRVRRAITRRAGAVAVLVNNLGYRQTETWKSAEPGDNVVLTIDLDIQQARSAHSWRTKALTRVRRSS